MNGELELVKHRIEEIPFKSARREYNEFKFFRREKRTYVKGLHLLLGQPGANVTIGKVIDDYLNSLNLDTVNSSYLFEDHITRRLTTPSDLHLTIIPLKGTLTTLDKNTVYVLNLAGKQDILALSTENKKGIEQVSLGKNSSLAFNAVVRVNPGGFGFRDYIRREIGRRLLNKLWGQKAITQDVFMTTSLAMKAFKEYYKRSIAELQTFDGLRLSAEKRDPAYEEQYLTRAKAMLDLRWRNLVQMGLHQVEMQEYGAQRPWPYDANTIVEAYQRKLVDFAPLHEWFELYYSATDHVEQTYKISEILIANLNLNKVRLTMSYRAPELDQSDGLYSHLRLGDDLPQFDQEVIIERAGFDPQLVKNEVANEGYTDIVSPRPYRHYEVDDNGGPKFRYSQLGDEEHNWELFLVPRYIDPKSAGQVMELYGAASAQDKPSVLGIETDMRDNEGNMRTVALSCLVLPDLYGTGDYLPKVIEKKQVELSKGRMTGSFNLSDNPEILDAIDENDFATTTTTAGTGIRQIGLVELTGL